MSQGASESSTSSMLVALAILQVNSDRKNATYLDNFYPFITGALESLDGSARGHTELSAEIKARTGLYIPPGAIRSIVRRMQQRKLVREDPNTKQISLNPDITRGDVGRSTRQFVRQERSFLREFTLFAESRGLEVTEESARHALITFVEQHGIRLLRLHYSVPGEHRDSTEDLNDSLEPAVGDDPDMAPPADGDSVIQVALAIYIRDLFESDNPLAEHVVAWVQGMMLASSIYRDDAEEVIKPFVDATLYLDTRVLLRAVGLCGDELRDATLPTLELSSSAEGSLACFQHNVDEMQDILYAIADAMKYGRQAERVQEVERHLFAQPGINDRKVKRIADELPAAIEALNVTIAEKPSFEPYELQISEDELRSELRSIVGEKLSEIAIRRDVDSLASVFRLRDGKTTLSLEKCRALLVTTSTGLCSASRKHFKLARAAVPLAVLENELQTAVWLKHPIKVADTVPRARVIAHCYATLQPDPSLWSAYLAKLDAYLREEKRPEVDFIYLRYAESAREALIDVSLGNPDRLTHESITEVLRTRDEVVVEEIRSELEAQAERSKTLEERLAEQQAKAASIEAEKSALQSNLTAREREIERLKRKDRGSERHERQMRNRSNRARADGPAVKPQAASPTPTLAGDSVPASQTAADSPTGEEEDSARVDELIDWLSQDRAKRASRALAAVPGVLLIFAVISAAFPDAIWLRWMPPAVKTVLIVLVIVATVASLFFGWNFRDSIMRRLKDRIRKHVLAELPRKASK